MRKRVEKNELAETCGTISKSQSYMLLKSQDRKIMRMGR